MHALHAHYLDGFLRDLDSINPPLAKSRFICVEASLLNRFIPHPTADEVNKYLLDHNLPAICNY
jgi:hypothetical protein